MSYFEQQLKRSISSQQFTLVSALTDEFDQKLLAAKEEVYAVAQSITLESSPDSAGIQEFLDNRLDTRLFLTTVCSSSPATAP